jgi:hypothetical protein
MLSNFGAGTHTAYHQDMAMWLVCNAKERTLNELKIIGQVHSIFEYLTMIDLLLFTGQLLV